MSDAHDTEDKLWEMIKDIRVAMLTTMNGERLESRPMQAYVEPENRQILFLTRLDSGKAHEIGHGTQVNLGFSSPDHQSYVSISGTATASHDGPKQNALWSKYAEAWLPEGPDAPTTGLIRVTPEHATLWDSPSSKLVRLFQVAKANVTQTPPAMGKVEHVDL